MTRQREHWGTRIGFILAAAGSAIGLGSLWKFPYVTGENGGGAFVLVYLISTVLICIPLFMAELVMGRTTQKCPVGAFTHLSNHSQNWRGVGWLAILSTLVVYSYYAIVAGWTLNYVLLSLSQFTKDKSPEQIMGVFNILVESGDINLLWQVIMLLLTAAVVYGGVRKGIEYWAKILTPLLFCLLIALFLYSMTLPGFSRAIQFILYPDFRHLSAAGVLSALGLSFFTASLGFGVILTYGSYLRPEENIPKTATIVLVLTLLVSLVAALTIFPIIFSFGFEPTEGPGLVFKTMPVLFEKLPGTLIISTTFFALLFFTALTSTVSLLENLVAQSMELFEWTRKRAVFMSTLAVFVIGLPSALAGSKGIFSTWESMYGQNFFNTIAATWDRWFLPLTGLLTSIFVGWKIDARVAKEGILQGTTWRWIFRPWRFLMRWVVPLAIFILILEATEIIHLTNLFAD